MLRIRPVSVLALLLTLGACTPAEPTQSPTPQASPASAATSQASVEAATIGSIPNLTRVGNVYFSGQPSPGDLERAKDAGITAVINLRHPAELGGFNEERAVQALGMAYDSVPWNGPAELTDSVFDSVRALLSETESPTLLHCASANRSGAAWLPYRVLDQGVDLEQAVTEARRIGMRTPGYEEAARAYIARNR